MNRFSLMLPVCAWLSLSAAGSEPSESPTGPEQLTIRGQFQVRWTAETVDAVGARSVQEHTLGDVTSIHFYDRYIVVRTAGGGGRAIGAERLVSLSWEPLRAKEASPDPLEPAPAPAGDESVANPPAVSPSEPSQHQPELDVRLERWLTIEDFDEPIAQFESVFWDPRDTISVRQLIRDTPLVHDKTVLEIGTGTGLLSLCCLKAGAARVVATDVNPWAIENAIYNAERLGVRDRFETRLVPRDSPSAYPVIGASERFDLIISNPPWEDKKPVAYADYAYYDENFELLRTLLADLKKHLNPGGKALLVYGYVEAIRKIQQLGPQYGLAVRVLDDRNLDDLTAEFLPGMMLEVVPQP